MNSLTKSKVHPASATAPAEGVPVVPQCAPGLLPAGEGAGGTQSPLTTSSKATVSGVRSGEVASASCNECWGWASCYCFTTQTATLLGFEPQHISPLIGVRLLKTAGTTAPMAPKYSFTKYILELAADERWITRASDALVAHWAKRNKAKQSTHNGSDK